MKYKLVAFDMDGTLLTEKSSWWKLHRYFGTYESSLKNMEDYERGKIAYDEFMRRDITLWTPRPHVSTIRRVLLDYDFVLNARYVVNILIRRKYHLALITTGLDILANAVASELHIPHILANGLVFDKKGYLTPKVIFEVDLLRKEKAFNRLIHKMGISRHECVGVGDSKYDISFLRFAGLGIAFNGNKDLRNATDIVISDLKQLLNFI